MLEVQRLQPGGDTALGGVDGDVSGLVTSMQPVSSAAAGGAAATATMNPGSNHASAESRRAKKLEALLRPGSRAKAPPQPLRHRPQQRQKKDKRKR